VPDDVLHEPYMAREELRREIDDGVRFWGWRERGVLAGVMGLQRVSDVVLIRHAYVRMERQGEGIGARLLAHLLEMAQGPVLIGTWAAAVWAVGFYQKHGFTLVSEAEKERLLRRYWKISERQVATSVVLANRAWRER